MILRNAKVLVTGAGGFIGSHLVSTLLEQGAKIRAFLHYNSRNDIGNLKFLTKEELSRTEIVFGNIEDQDCVNLMVKNCNCIFHLAALIDIPYSYIAPRSYLATNIIGTLNILEAMRTNKTLKLVHTSTSEVYGTAISEFIDENHPLQAQSPYSFSKISADKLVESYYRSFNVQVSTIRPFNTYGPRQSGRAVIPTIITQLLSGNENLELGLLTPMRDFTYIDDTIQAFIAIAESKNAIGETINIGTGKTISIGELAQKLVNMINPSAKIISKKERFRPKKSEVMKLICSNTKAYKTLGWEPKISLEKGLLNTIAFIRKNLDFYKNDCYIS